MGVADQPSTLEFGGHETDPRTPDAEHDCIGRDSFPLTQEFVAIMLGATRQTVAITAGLLQKAGFITYHRGQMLILERERLEAAACEC